MKLIVISAPQTIENEISIIEELIEKGLEYYHLRKPDWTINQTREFIGSLSEESRKKLIIHDYYELFDEFRICGCHRNKRNINNSFGNNFSVSCHKITELSEWNNLIEGYMFLSPIYDSISKEGYTKNFDNSSLKNAFENGFINKNVIALGGVELKHIPEIFKYGFGGIAVLGAIWKNYNNDIDLLIKRFEDLKSEIEKY